MTEIFDPISSLESLKLPAATHLQLVFCAGNKVLRVREWVEQLRATQAVQTGADLYRALPEVLRLKTEAVTRYEMLEALRPAVHQAVQGLTKEFLHQPLLLPEQAQKTAIIAQALQKNMLDGYSLVVLELAKSTKVNNYERLIFNQALHRAITALGLLFIRSFQLYTQVPSGLWSQLHTLYRCAKFYELHDGLVQDLLYTQSLSSIEDAYMRVLALGAGRLNQVAQNDVQWVYDALGEWSHHIRPLPLSKQDKDNLYWVNLNRDRGPQLKARYEGPQDEALIELNFKPLLNQLDRKENLAADNRRLVIPDDFPVNLINHLRDAWGNLSNRDLDRRQAGEAASVCIGFSECHYQMAGEQTFDKFLQIEPTGQSYELPSFANLGRLGKGAEVEEMRLASLGQVFDVTLLNLSAGGYCLQWNTDVPAQLEAGELIALREAGRRSWNLCVVRWIRRLKTASQMGLQLISTQAQAFAASAQYDDGSYSDYMRAFYVPAARQGLTPASLVTAPMPFQEHQSVRLKQDDRTVPAKLEKCIFATAKLRQFAFIAMETDD